MYYFSEFPKQVAEPVAIVPDEYAFVAEENDVPTISGTLYEDDSSSNLMLDMDLCVYTETKENRPWIGRVANLFPQSRQFDVHWYEVGVIRRHFHPWF